MTPRDQAAQRVVEAARQLIPFVREMLPRHPTNNLRINTFKRVLDQLEAALHEYTRHESTGR